MNFSEHEERLFLEDILFNENLERYSDDIKEVLDKYYQYDTEIDEYTDPLGENYHKYEIRVIDEYECCDDCFRNIIYIEIKLPNDEAALELAGCIDGEVTDGLNSDSDTYRVLFTSEVCVKANSPEEAQKLVESMIDSDRRNRSRFVEVSTATLKKE
jgi:hypothetical protein